MNTRRRLDIIEMTLTPRQVVNLVLKDAQEQGTFVSVGVDLARHPAACSPRTRVMEMVARAVRDSMKGYPDAVVGRATRHARQEADFLFLLAISMNSTILEHAPFGAYFTKAIARHLRTILKTVPTADELDECRESFQWWLEELVILEDVIAGITAQYFDGQQVLFNDSAEKLEQQLGNATHLVSCFNLLAKEIGSQTLDLQGVRIRLEPAVEQQITNKAALARAEMLITFGEPDTATRQLIRILSRREAGNGATQSQPAQ